MDPGPAVYVIEDTGFDRTTRSVAFRTLLAWASTKGTSFRISVQAHLFRDKARLQRLEALGPVERLGRVPFSRLTFRAKVRTAIETLLWLGQPPPDNVHVAGPLVTAMIEELASDLTPPEGAEGGDLGAVEDLEVFEGSQELYSARQYACFQTLHLSEERVEEVQNALKEAGVSPTLLRRLEGAGSKPGSVAT